MSRKRFLYDVTGSTDSSISNKDIHKALKGIGKFQFVSKLTILLNL